MVCACAKTLMRAARHPSVIASIHHLEGRCSSLVGTLSSRLMSPSALSSRVSVASSPAAVRRGARRARAFRASPPRASAAAADAAPDVPSTKRVVILGGGIQACSIAYYLSKRGVPSTIVERTAIAAAASGKSGGFLAGGWGDGGVTQTLHRESFALHASLAEELQLRTYRKIPTLSVAGGPTLSDQRPPVSWLDGDVARAELMDDATAQVTPSELTARLHEEAMRVPGAETIIAEAVGVVRERDPDDPDPDSNPRVKGVEVRDHDTGEITVIPADVCVVAMGPWSTRASEWFDVDVPMTGVKSVSLVYDASAAVAEEPAALFCAEDANGCHLEVYPRSTGEVYICGCGGSEYVDESRLLPGGDLDRAERVSPDPSRVAAASASFAGLSASVGAGGPKKTQSCMRPCPPDALPILGGVPGTDGAYMCCGHNCWGILWAPVSGKIVSELVVDGRSSVNLAPFSPGRFMTRAQKRGKKMRDVNVGEQW